MTVLGRYLPYSTNQDFPSPGWKIAIGSLTTSALAALATCLPAAPERFFFFFFSLAQYLSQIVIHKLQFRGIYTSRYIILSSLYITWEGLNNILLQRNFVYNDALTCYTQILKQLNIAWEGLKNIPPYKLGRIRPIPPELKPYNSNKPQEAHDGT